VPIAQPLFDLGFVRLAEDFVIGLQGCNCENNPVSVRRMINIHTQVLVAPLCQGTQHSFQNSLWGWTGANLVNDDFIVRIVVWFESSRSPVHAFSDLKWLAKSNIYLLCQGSGWWWLSLCKLERRIHYEGSHRTSASCSCRSVAFHFPISPFVFALNND
jgi:hypothetical protein